MVYAQSIPKYSYFAVGKLVNPSADSVSSHSHLRPSSPPTQGFESPGFDSPHWDSSSKKSPSPPSPVIPDVCPRPEGGISYPPSAHWEFVTRAAADNLDTMKQQLLHPTEVVPDADRGRRRNSWSGSRDRGIGRAELHSAPGSSRTSPYPSPNASPLLSYDSLPPIPSLQILPAPSGMGQLDRPTSTPAYGASFYGILPYYTGELSGQLSSGGNLSDEGLLSGKPIHGLSAINTVSTTTVTAEASERRRKTDANFACPVPGCGRTFTRHFNLKGAFHGCPSEMVLT